MRLRRQLISDFNFTFYTASVSAIPVSGAQFKIIL